MGKKMLSYVAVCLILAAPAFAQSDTQPAPQDARPQTAPSPRQFHPDFTAQVVKTYYFSHLAHPTEIQDVVNAMRMILEFQRVQPVPGRSAIIVRGTEDQVARADKLVADLDQARGGAGPATYKLEFTVHQFENGKKINDRSYSVIVERGRAREDANKYSLKAGSKIPVITGSASAGTSQYTYMDIGMNFDCRLWGRDDDLTLQSTVEVSSISMPQQQSSPTQPTVRQAKADLVSPITGTKPVTIASFDEVDAPRRMDIEVTATKLR